MSFANDVSYLVDNKIIVLAEHQSTVNPNMPLKNASKTIYCGNIYKENQHTPTRNTLAQK